jgi:TRAP-type C4-dicarboxylate transport system substrate-binding protein
MPYHLDTSADHRRATRRQALRGLAAATAGLAAAGLLAGAVAAEPVTIRIASVNAPTTVSNTVVQQVAGRITDRTEGRVQFEFFPSAQLGTTTDTLEQASQGQPIVTFTSASFMSTFGVPELAVVEGPFVIADNTEGDRLANSDLMQGWYDQLADKAGIRVLALNWFDGPRHMIGTAPYPTPDDLKGVLMRVPPVETWIKTFEPLGVVPTTVEAAEAYSALAQGVVTAAESPLTGLRASKWFEVAKHITLTGHFNLFTGWVMSEATFDALSEADRAIVIEEFRKGGQEVAAQSAALANEIRTEFEAAGVTFHEADLDAYRAATAGFYTSFPAWPAGLFDQVRAAATGN